MKPTILLCLLLIIISITVNILFFLVLPDGLRINQSVDYRNYYEPVARNLLAGKGLTLTDGAAAIGYTPGYPIILACLFAASEFLGISEEIIIKVFILICMAITSVFVFLLAGTLLRPLRAAIASIIWITYPPILWIGKQPNSEIPFLLFFYGSLLILWHGLSHGKYSPLRYFIAGILIGIAILVRPMAIGIPFIMIAIIWYAAGNLSRKKRIHMIAMIVVGSLIAVLPWEVWAYSKTGKILPLSAGGEEYIAKGISLKKEPVPSSISDAAAIIKKNPIKTLKLFMLKPALCWYRISQGTKLFEKIFLPFQLLYLTFAFWGLRKTWRDGIPSRNFAGLILLILLYSLFITILGSPLLRYMTPAIGLLLIFIPKAFPGRLLRDG